MCNASNAERDAATPTVWQAARLSGQALACQRGMRLLFDNLNFSLASGEALIVVGANGAGKSSLLRIIAGLLAATSGRVTLTGLPGESVLAEQIHYLGHEDALKAALTVEANLSFWRAALGPTGLTVDAALEEVGLSGLERLRANVLSAGQKRRLAIARLLVARRPVWVLDEPTTALDMRAQARFAALGRAHLEQGGMILAATHAPLDLGPAARELVLGGVRP